MESRSCLADISEFQNNGEHNRDFIHYTFHVVTAILRRLRKRLCKIAHVSKEARILKKQIGK